MSKSRKRRKYSHHLGQPPGYLPPEIPGIFPQQTIQFYYFNKSKASFHELDNFQQSENYPSEGHVKWFNIDDIQNIPLLAKAGGFFSLHPLLLEDITNSEHLPKLEDYPKHVYLILKTLSYNSNENWLQHGHVNLVLGDGYVFSVKETSELNVFESIENKILEGHGKVREKQADFLFYRLVDVIVDNYFIVLEALTERIEELEEQLIKKPGDNLINQILDVKKQLILIRKYILPLREQISTLTIKDLPYISDETRNFFKDIYDHLNHQVSITDSMLEMLKGLMDLYISNINISTNNVMKILTVVTAIFIPLTFLTGIYGMNFRYMPGLDKQWSFYIMMAMMIILIVIQLFYMKKRKWF